MWIYIFFIVLAVVIIIYVVTVKKETDRDEFLEDKGTKDDDETRPHSPLR